MAACRWGRRSCWDYTEDVQECVTVILAHVGGGHHLEPEAVSRWCGVTVMSALCLSLFSVSQALCGPYCNPIHSILGESFRSIIQPRFLNKEPKVAMTKTHKMELIC